MARLLVQRPKSLIVAAVMVVFACVWILQSRQNFDSEVLNLLPQGLESVQALKVLNSDFAQARELTFALQGESDVVAEFADHFLEALRLEPWVVRVFAGSPMETPEGIDALQGLVPRLLLNLDPPAFNEALQLLAPEAIGRRLQHLRAEIEAGSMKAEMQLTNDPLGLLGAAMKPMASIYGAESGQSLSSDDGTLRVVPVVTNQPSLSQPDCRALMEQADDFTARVRESWKGAAPRILVTGRSAYVAQISASMERDVRVTSIVSIVMVAGLFYLGFRRLLPLAGIIVTLGLSCFVAFAIGSLLFENLNMIAIAFCSILVGLGDDFSLLLYNRYLHARAAHQEHEAAIATSIAEVGPGIAYVSITTGIGFLVLLLSGSAGFAQLGTLIAIGIVLCGAFMLTLFFLFIRPQQPSPARDPFGALVDRYAHWVLRKPGRLAGPMLAVLVITLCVAALPLRPLRFDTSPRSLEPAHSPAAIALRTITEKIAAASEPVVVLVEAEDAQQAHDRWATLTAHLDELTRSGELKSVSSPAALLMSPARIRQHQQALGAIDLAASRAAFEQALLREEFNPDGFPGARVLLDRLENAVTAGAELLDLRHALPPTSGWWFLIDRYFSSRPHTAAAYLRPARPLDTAQEQALLEQRIREGGVPVRVTGWSYAMVSLVPWAKRELLMFSSGVAVLILVLLGMAYRAWRPWLIHIASLLFAVSATVATLKLAGIQINLLNALAFPLVLGVGVDYGLHLLFAAREEGDPHANLVRVLKPLVICGLTTISGFGSLILARNPALSGLGLLCALGVAWSLIASLLIVLPLSVFRHRAPSDLPAGSRGGAAVRGGPAD